MRIFILISITLALFSLPAGSVNAKVLGTVGRTYPIAEKDAVTELQDRASQVDWKLMYSKVRPENYRPEDLKDIPRARKSRSFMMDMTYTLDADIPDGKGGILYPAGYSFNPLDYVPFDKTLVVIDGTDSEQVSWFAGSKYKGQTDVMLLISNGSAIDLQKQLKRPVFYATRPIIQRFALVAVPSVIHRKDRLMEVAEIALPYHSQCKTTEASEK
jgi:conjugal transfer pilus assembly protein TraW